MKLRQLRDAWYDIQRTGLTTKEWLRATVMFLVLFTVLLWIVTR